MEEEDIQEFFSLVMLREGTPPQQPAMKTGNPTRVFGEDKSCSLFLYIMIDLGSPHLGYVVDIISLFLYFMSHGC